eukprot:gnl/TRDRNA2_/TRDRNA2_82107_c0_seq1.p1 gnl/TRDRNA2_/TRDRNA2_82107_c0~~gnl/TRDRNA2_/TRDRNA2_82107_c0_seq1.p1  ORF type:complete len:595 (+),score=101.51 gnl/TRDRNA2_/TRDRNA2_82107_c0_seq1:75-1859(+)
MLAGINCNDILSYKTPKYVAIRDWRLGALQKTLMLLIFVKIVCLGIIYNCNHLKPLPVHGSARANLAIPTQGCSPYDDDCKARLTPMSQLPYCEQGSGSAPQAPATKLVSAKAFLDGDDNSTNATPGSGGPPSAADDRKDNVSQPAPSPSRSLAASTAAKPGKIAHCKFWDGIKMSLGHTPVPGTLFIPTRVTIVKQRASCQPSESNSWSCESRPFVFDEGADQVPPFFLADVENYTVLINQAWQVESASGIPFTGRAGDFDAFLAPEPVLSSQPVNAGDGQQQDNGGQGDNHKKKSIQGLLQHMEGAKVKQYHIPKRDDINGTRALRGTFRNVFSSRHGDIISVADLLKLSDPRGASLLDMTRIDGSTMRWDGAIISVSIEYTNKVQLDPLGQTEPHYIITTSFLPMKEYKIRFDRDTQDGGRYSWDAHGILLIFTVHGSILQFDLTYLLQMLTTAMVSLAIAATATDAIMMYVMDFKSKYLILKYQPSQDFGIFREAIARVKSHYGNMFNPNDHKPLAHADILNNLAESGQAPKDKELLLILLKFEQRLNRLDGMDEFNVIRTEDATGDKASRFITAFEKSYQWKELMRGAE